MASTAANDKDKATTSAPRVDFNTLPESVLASYVEYYSLAPNYPPPPPPRAASYSSSEEDEPEDEEGDQDEGEDDGEIEDTRTEEEMLAEASGKRRAALASAAATSTSYSRDNRFRARTPPATATNASGGKKRSVDEMNSGETSGRAEDAEGEPCPADFFDEDDARSYLANIAQRHFAAQPPPKEGEVVVGFLYRCRTKEKCLKIA